MLRHSSSYATVKIDGLDIREMILRSWLIQIFMNSNFIKTEMTLAPYTVFLNFTIDIQRENLSVIGYRGDAIRKIGFNRGEFLKGT